MELGGLELPTEIEPLFDSCRRRSLLGGRGSGKGGEAALDSFGVERCAEPLERLPRESLLDDLARSAEANAAAETREPRRLPFVLLLFGPSEAHTTHDRPPLPRRLAV